MTEKNSTSFWEVVITLLIGAVAVAVVGTGVFFGLSSLWGTVWWVNLLILWFAVGLTVGAFQSEPVLGFGLLSIFAVFGFVRSLGWLITALIVIAGIAGTVRVARPGSQKPTSDPPAPSPHPERPNAPSSPSRPRTVTDEILERYAREFLTDGGARNTRAVVSALRSHIKDEGIELGQGQDVSWIASRALSSTRSSAPSTGQRRATAASRRGASVDKKAGQSRKKPKRDVREKLHEFGSFEIERAITSILGESPGLTDEQLGDRVLEELGTTDRSPFALERLTDAIGRVRGHESPSTEERAARQRERRIARVAKRDPGGRTNLYEFGSHEIERVVDELLAAERRWTQKDLHEAVLEVLGIEDRSKLGRQRVADAAKRTSPTQPSAASPTKHRRESVAKQRPVKKATKRTAKKATKRTAKKATKRTAKKQSPSPAAKKGTKKAPAKNGASGPRRKKAEPPKRTTDDGARRTPATSSDRGRDTGRKDPSPRPAKEPPTPAGDEATPDVKDIAKLLGF